MEGKADDLRALVAPVTVSSVVDADVIPCIGVCVVVG